MGMLEGCRARHRPIRKFLGTYSSRKENTDASSGDAESPDLSSSGAYQDHQGIAKHEGITFAEMTRRCLHLGLRAIVEDHAAFLKVVEAAQKTKAASMAAQVPPS